MQNRWAIKPCPPMELEEQFGSKKYPRTDGGEYAVQLRRFYGKNN
jgi:hypothetical protein